MSLFNIAVKNTHNKIIAGRLAALAVGVRWLVEFFPGKIWNYAWLSSISISDDDDQEIQDEQCSEVEEKCEIISKDEVGSDVPGESCSEEVETDQEWETFEEVQ